MASSLARAVKTASKGLPIWKGAPRDWATKIADKYLSAGEAITKGEASEYLRDKGWYGCEACSGSGIQKARGQYQYGLFGGRETATYKCPQCEGTGLDPVELGYVDDQEIVDDWSRIRPPGRRGPVVPRRKRGRRVKREMPLGLLESRLTRLRGVVARRSRSGR